MYEAHVGTLESTQFNVENVHLQTQLMRDNVQIVKIIFKSGSNIKRL